jgi:hypothetical protein
MARRYATLHRTATEAYERVLDRNGGRSSLAEAVDELISDLHGLQEDAEVLREIATVAINDVDRHVAKPSTQPTLSDEMFPQSVLALGEGQRVRFGVAIEEEYDAWWLLQQMNKASVDRAHAEKFDQYRVIKQTWRTMPGARGEQVWAALP